MDGRLIKAVAHPLRVRILNELERRDIVSPIELAVAWDESLGVISYHVRRLHALGFLELARRTPVRGAMQHHYRAKRRRLGWSIRDVEMPQVVRSAIISAQARSLVKDVGAAVEGGGFDDGTAVLSHGRVSLDAIGREQLAEAMHVLDERAQEIAAESAARLDAGSGDPRSAVVALLLFSVAEDQTTASQPRARRSAGLSAAR